MAPIPIRCGGNLLLQHVADTRQMPTQKKLSAALDHTNSRASMATAKAATSNDIPPAGPPARLLPTTRLQSLQRAALGEGIAATPAFADGALDSLISRRRRIKKGESLFYAGEPLTFLYAVCAGSFKTTLVSADGRSQVTGFFMSGDILGLDALSMERHACGALALEDSEVCPIAFNLLERLGVDFPAFQQHFNRALSLEIVRGQALLLMVGCYNADERLASFLLVLSECFVRRGFSARCFLLRMSREDMASYLGLRMETVCRSMARFREMGLIAYQGRLMEILDPQALLGQAQFSHKRAFS